MITVRIPTDKNFDFYKCRCLFNEKFKGINDTYSFDEILKTTMFYSYYDGKKLLGCNFFFMEDGKLFIGAFGIRHHLLDHIKCFKMTLDWFNCDIYAKSVQKPAIMLLLKCGFKKVSDDIYKYERI